MTADTVAFFSSFKATPISTTSERFYESFIFVRLWKMGG